MARVIVLVSGSGTSAHNPKSMTANFPSFVTNMFPGCGSAWKWPGKNHIRLRESWRIYRERQKGRWPVFVCLKIGAFSRFWDKNNVIIMLSKRYPRFSFHLGGKWEAVLSGHQACLLWRNVKMDWLLTCFQKLTQKAFDADRREFVDDFFWWGGKFFTFDPLRHQHLPRCHVVINLGDVNHAFHLGQELLDEPASRGVDNFKLIKQLAPPVEFSTDLKFRQTALSYNQNCIA